jgi:hypothetical protein
MDLGAVRRLRLRTACCLLSAVGLAGLLVGCSSAPDPLMTESLQAG